jgi:hypothetical protein
MRNQCYQCAIISKIKHLRPSKFFNAPKIAKFSVSLNMTKEEISQHIRDFVLEQKRDLVDYHFNEMLAAYELQESEKSCIRRYKIDCHEILEDLEIDCLDIIRLYYKASGTDEHNIHIQNWSEIQRHWKTDFKRISYIFKKTLYILQWGEYSEKFFFLDIINL